ncbi:peroxidase, family 2 domain-containing protein [Hirsutella rhossiliensis]
MKYQTISAILLSLFASSFSLVESAKPRVNLKDARFQAWKPAGSGDSRSACPGLNSLANHGFLPHNGQGVNAVSIVRASFEGFGMSPEVPAIIILKALQDANLPLNATFSLHDADRKSWKIEHTRSFSREDLPPADQDLPPVDTSRFHERPWKVALRVMKRCGEKVDADCFARARAARIIDGKRRKPKTNYDMAAAAHGAVESARIMLVLGNKHGANLKYIQSVFEKERLPRHLGWKPKAFSGDIDSMLDLAVKTQKPSKVLRCASNGRVASRFDIIRLFESNRTGFIVEVEKLIKKAGFTDIKSIVEALDGIEDEKRQGRSQNINQSLKSECGRKSPSRGHDLDSDGHDSSSDNDDDDSGSDNEDDDSGSDNEDDDSGSDDEDDDSGLDNDDDLGSDSDNDDSSLDD